MNKKNTIFNKEDGSEWISISDLSFGLMIVFMFIAVSYMAQIEKKNQEMENLAKSYIELKETIYTALQSEFQKDLKRWKAKIDKKTLSITFNSPKILFKPGKSKLKKEFQKILTSFFPRYISVLTSKDIFIKEIEEIRIEGHTSSEKFRGLSKNKSYYRNVQLSQERTLSVLEYSFSIRNNNILKNKEWLMSHITANGLASIKPILNDQGAEDKVRSKRVEFRVRIKAESRIHQIVKKLNNNEAH